MWPTLQEVKNSVAMVKNLKGKAVNGQVFNLGEKSEGEWLWLWLPEPDRRWTEKWHVGRLENIVLPVELMHGSDYHLYMHAAGVVMSV